jgi:hypothetical protein
MPFLILTAANAVPAMVDWPTMRWRQPTKRPSFEPIVGDIHAVLAENQRTGRNANDVGVARQFESDLGVGSVQPDDLNLARA